MFQIDIFLIIWIISSQCPSIMVDVSLETGQFQCTIFGRRINSNFLEWMQRLLGWEWSNPRRDNGFGTWFNTLLLMLLLFYTIIKCLLVNGINGETEGDFYGSWLVRSGQAFCTSSFAQENLALPWSKTQRCLLLTTAALVSLGKSALSRRLQEAGPLVNLMGKPWRGPVQKSNYGSECEGDLKRCQRCRNPLEVVSQQGWNCV